MVFERFPILEERKKQDYAYIIGGEQQNGGNGAGFLMFST